MCFCCGVGGGGAGAEDFLLEDFGGASFFVGGRVDGSGAP